MILGRVEESGGFFHIHPCIRLNHGVSLRQRFAAAMQQGA